MKMSRVIKQLERELCVGCDCRFEELGCDSAGGVRL